MGKRTRTYVTTAIGRRTLRPHVPSPAQIRRGAYPAASISPSILLIVVALMFILCGGAAITTLTSALISNTSAALSALH